MSHDSQHPDDEDWAEITLPRARPPPTPPPNAPCAPRRVTRINLDDQVRFSVHGLTEPGSRAHACDNCGEQPRDGYVARFLGPRGRITLCARCTSELPMRMLKTIEAWLAKQNAEKSG